MEQYSPKLRLHLHLFCVFRPLSPQQSSFIYLVFLEHLLGTRHYARKGRRGWPALNGAYWVVWILNRESHKQKYNYHVVSAVKEGV